MLDFVTIEKIAVKAAKSQIAGTGFERVLIEPAVDSEGKDALRITVILRPEAIDSLSGDAALDLLVNLQRELVRENEERFPILEYTTEEELREEKLRDEEPEDGE